MKYKNKHVDINFGKIVSWIRIKNYRLAFYTGLFKTFDKLTINFEKQELNLREMPEWYPKIKINLWGKTKLPKFTY